MEKIQVIRKKYLNISLNISVKELEDFCKLAKIKNIERIKTECFEEDDCNLVLIWEEEETDKEFAERKKAKAASDGYAAHQKAFQEEQEKSLLLQLKQKYPEL